MGEREGLSLGEWEGEREGLNEGDFEGFRVGEYDTGLIVGELVGPLEGDVVGSAVELSSRCRSSKLVAKEDTGYDTSLSRMTSPSSRVSLLSSFRSTSRVGKPTPRETSSTCDSAAVTPRIQLASLFTSTYNEITVNTSHPTIVILTCAIRAGIRRV